MQVAILAGGLGTRIQSVAPDIPKALIPVAGRPFVEHQFQLLKSNGLTDVLLCVGNKGEMIRAHVGNGSAWGMNVSYSFEDPNGLLGTGGALVNAFDKLDDEFLVLYGDSYLPTDYGKVVGAFEDSDMESLMCVYRNEGQWDSSNTRIEGDRVIFYSKAAEEGEADYIDYGLTAYRKSVIREYLEEPLPLDLARIMADQVAAGEMAAFVVNERFYEIGKPEGLRELDELLRKG